MRCYLYPTLANGRGEATLPGTDIDMKILYSTIILFILAGCGGNTDSVTLELVSAPETQEAAPTIIPEHSISQTGTNVSRLGHDDARQLLATCTTESDIRAALLNINARRYRLATMVSDEVADEYMNGFLDELRISGDTLYNALSPLEQLPQ